MTPGRSRKLKEGIKHTQNGNYTGLYKYNVSDY